jgi:hypothetical protein
MKLAFVTASELVLLVQEQIISKEEAREALGADLCLQAMRNAKVRYEDPITGQVTTESK